MHEYVLLFRKRGRSMLALFWDTDLQAQQRVAATWRSLVKTVLMALGGKSDLQTIYARIAKEAPDRLAKNPNWQAKVRQTLNSTATLFKSDERGVWALV